MESEAKLFTALSDPTRLEIISALARKKGCVSELQLVTGKNQPNISQHLRVLREAGIVEYRKEGKKVCYFLGKPEIKEIMRLAGKI